MSPGGGRQQQKPRLGQEKGGVLAATGADGGTLYRRTLAVTCCTGELYCS